MDESEKTPRRSAKKTRCAIYTRKLSEEGLEQAFNSLDAQREARAAFVASQKHEGWTVLPTQRDFALIRRTVALDTTDDEFALFIHWARSLRLDPLRRQVHAFVFHKHDPKKRRLSLVTSIEGSAIAARTGNYRPDENEPGFIADDTLKADTNPLVSCSIRVWQHSHKQWFPITGVARWEEFAPSRRSGSTISRLTVKSSTSPAAGGTCPSSCSPNARRRKPSARAGRRTSATRSSVRSEQAALLLNPFQAAAEGATRERLERIGGSGALIIDWLDAAPLDAVPVGQLADRIVAFLRERREDPQALITWRERNRHALREFWTREPADALGVKQEFEKALAQPGMPAK